MKKHLLIFAIFVSHISFGAVDSLIMNHASWKYLDINVRQTNWEKTNAFFNDASWAKGNAQLGYGEGDEQKVVGFGTNANDKYVTTYFRKSFNVNNPALYGSLTLNLIRDDGVVVYLNGVEIIRNNLPTGTILHSTGASVGIGVNENDWIPYTIPTTNLATGNNVIAVEIHQYKNIAPEPFPGQVTSSDVSFNLTLAANVSTAVGGDTLVNNNSYWRYLDNGSNQGTAWYTNAFTGANTWAAGNAELGYGDGDEVTVVGYGGNPAITHITTYFRRIFNVAAGASYTSLDLSLVCDDGAVVYLNGTEIYRNNMPTGAIGHTIFANNGTTNENNWNNVTLCNGVLLAGQPNVIAVEIHQASLASSDISFNLKLKGNTTGNCPVLLTRKPYLQMIGTNSVVVRWQTSVPTNGKVFYGVGLTNMATDPNISTEHEVAISGLTVNTTYDYQIGYTSPTTLNFPTDALTFFKTALPAGTTTDFTAWVTGDFGNGSVGQLGVRNSYINYANNPTPLAKKADIWLWLGDNAYADGTPNEYTATVFGIYPDIMKNTPIFPAVGNHDYANFGNSPLPVGVPVHPLPYHDNHEYFKVFSMPTTGQLGGVGSTTKRYYSYNYGNVHFIVLDSYGVVTDNTTNPMYVWLQSDLAANTKKWIVCYFHHAPYSMGTHNSDLQFSMTNIRRYFVPLLESYHADLVLSGHSHVYERSYLIKGHHGIESTLTSAMKINGTLGNAPPYYVKSLVNGHGTVYAVCGNSGQGGIVQGVNVPNPVGTTNGYPHDAMAVSDKDHYGSMILTFRNNEIEAKYLQSDGTIADNFKIIKNPCVTGVTVEESVISGNWNVNSTWGCGTIPVTNSLVTIQNGHTVTITADTAPIKKIDIYGILDILKPFQLVMQH